MNKVRPLTFTAHLTFNRLQREKSELMRRLLEIDQEITNIVNSFGYMIDVEEVENYVANIQKEHTLRISKIGEVKGDVLGLGAWDNEKGKWEFLKDSSLKDPILIAAIECMLERNQFLSSLTKNDLTGVFYFVKEKDFKEELKLLGDAAPKIPPAVPEQPSERKLAKPIPSAPTPPKEPKIAPPKENPDSIKNMIESFKTKKNMEK